MSSSSQLQSYRGNCHCGAVKYTIKLPPIEIVTDCDCSYCFRRNSLWITGLNRKDLVLVSGAEQLQVYEFGKKMFSHEVGVGPQYVTRELGPVDEQ